MIASGVKVPEFENIIQFDVHYTILVVKYTFLVENHFNRSGSVNPRWRSKVQL